MRCTEEGIAHIREFEGLARLRADRLVYPYLCPAGVWTYGYGSTKCVKGQPVHSGTKPITKEVAETLLRRDVYAAEEDLRRLVKVPLNPHQISVLVSFVYNFGPGALVKSTLLRKLNAGDYEGAGLELPKWNKVREKGVPVVSPGLVRRRAAELAMWRKPCGEAVDEAHAVPLALRPRAI